MKMIKNIIEYLIAISVIPAIVLTVINVTELKDVSNVQYELLSEEGGIYNITPGTYEKLVANKRIKNYELESNYPLITQEEMERGMWKIDDDLKNEIYIDENGQKRIIVNVGRLILDETHLILSDDGNRLYITKPINSMGRNSWDYAAYIIPGYNIEQTTTLNNLYITHDTITDINELKSSLIGKSLYYELKIKNPNTMVIESNYLSITSDYVKMVKPNDFSDNPDGLLITPLMDYNHTTPVEKFEVTSNFIYIYPKEGISVDELERLMIGDTLIYERSQPRLVEVYDFSKFRLVFHKNRIRVTFDVDDGYYLWEITNDDKMIPINGQYDLGNIWTVKFYVYEIQQPLIRTLVLLIPLIVVSGVLLYMFNVIKKKGISY